MKKRQDANSTIRSDEQPFVSKQAPEIPAWFYKFGRILIALTILTISISCDISVAEVSGDHRWLIIRGVVSILLIFFFVSQINQAPNEVNFRAPPIMWLTLFIVIFSSLSMLWTISPYNSWWSLKHVWGYTGCFVFVYLLRSEKWYTGLLWIIALGVGFNCMIGIAQFYNLTDDKIICAFPAWQYVTAGFSWCLQTFYILTGTDKAILDSLPFFHKPMFLDLFRQTAPPAGTLANKNLLGSYLVLTMPAIFYLVLSSRKKSAQSLAATLFTIGIITLFYTRSRASWFAALCASIFLISWLLFHKQHLQILRSYCSKHLLITLGVVCIIAVGGGVAQGKLGTRSISKHLAQISRQDCHTFEVRMAYNLNSLAMIRERPLRGFGIGAFHTIYPAYYQAIRPTPSGGFSMHSRPSRMHNDLAQAFVELGIFGGAAYCGVFLALLLMTRQMGANAIRRNPALLSLCLMTGITALGINSLLDFPLQLPLAPTLAWSFAGMLTGLYVMRVEKPNWGAQSEPDRWQFFSEVAAMIPWLPKLSAPNRKPNIKLIIPRFVYILLTITAVSGGWAVFRDDWLRRKGDQYLKIAVLLSSAGRFDEQTLLYLRKSMHAYMWNVRLQEYRALIYANYNGTKIHVSMDERIDAVEDAVRYDPYSPHKLINLGGLYITKARELAAANRKNEALKYARQAEDIFKRMLNYQDFFVDLTYTIGGTAHMIQGALQSDAAIAHLNQARVLLEKAIAFNPRQNAAHAALKQTKALLANFPKDTPDSPSTPEGGNRAD